MNKNIKCFINICFLCLVSLPVYMWMSLLSNSKAALPYTEGRIQKAPVYYDVSKRFDIIRDRKNVSDFRSTSPQTPSLNRPKPEKPQDCDRVCNRWMTTCFDPEMAILVYNNISTKNMTFERKYEKLLPKIHKRKQSNNGNDSSSCPISDLDSSFDTMTTHENCAIVGNSGILLRSGCGKEIDAHDFVLRANLAKLNGYTDDVGNKTNMMLVNVHTVFKLNDVLKNHSATRRKERADMLQYLQSIQGAILWYAKETGKDTAKGLQEIATMMEEENIPVRFAFSLASTIGPTKRRWQTKAYPSSGLIMLVIAETFCKNITLYGFYPYNKNFLREPILHHYYQPELTEFQTKAHDFDQEHKLLKNLSQKGLFRLVLKPCTP